MRKFVQFCIFLPNCRENFWERSLTRGWKREKVSNSRTYHRHTCVIALDIFSMFFFAVFFATFAPPPVHRGKSEAWPEVPEKPRVVGGVLPPKLSHAAVSACLSPSLGLAPPPPATYPQPPRLSCPQPKPGQEPLARPGPGSPRRAAQCCSPRPLFFHESEKNVQGLLAEGTATCPYLRTLSINLSSNHITDHGAAALGDLCALAHLTSLDLTRVSPLGAR